MASDKVGLTMERTLREVGRVSYFDPRKLFDDKGNLKKPSEWDDDTAAAISHIGRNGPVPFDKNAALDKAMKHLGLYEKDNSQGAEAMAKLFVYVPEKNGRRVAKAA